MSDANDLVTVDVRDLSKVTVKLGDRAKDVSPAMAIVAEMLVSAVNDNFETAGHGTWPGLAESTKAKRRGTIYQILKDTGRAAGSIRGEHAHDYAEASSDVDYLKYHVGDGPRTVIPKRDPFELEEAVYEEAVDVIVDYVSQDMQ